MYGIVLFMKTEWSIEACCPDDYVAGLGPLSLCHHRDRAFLSWNGDQIPNT